MANSVTTTFFADEKAAHAAIVRLEKKYADLEQKIGQVSKRSRKSTGEILPDFDKWTASIASVASAYLALPALIGKASQVQAQLITQADEAALKFDQLFRRVRVQAGFTALQTEEAKKRIQGIAVETAVPNEVAAGAAEELVSQGFSAEEGTGKALKTLLETMKASNVEGGDPRALAQAAAMYLAAQGLDRTDANLREQMIAVQRMFKGTPLQIKDLQALAGKTQAMAGVMTPREVLAMYDILREKQTPENASTAFKVIGERLQTIAARPEDVRLLAKTGLKPKDLDLVGESIGEVLDRLAAGLEKLPLEEQNVLMSRLFGEEGRAPATGLIRDRALLKKRIAEMDDAAGFEADVAVATSGKAAGRTRMENARENELAERDTGFDDVAAAAELVHRARGMSEWAIAAMRWSSETLESLPVVGDFAAERRREGIETAREGTVAYDIKRVLEASRESNSQMLEILAEIAKNTRGRVARDDGGRP